MTNARKQGDTVPGRLDEIPTRWSLLRLAHRDTVTVAGEARNALVLRYARAIRKYVGALVRNDQDADEIAQEVVMRLLDGHFAGATPERGSFRRLLMVATRNLVRTYWSKQKRRAGAPGVDLDALVEENGSSLGDDEGLAGWKQTLLDLCWKTLEQHERDHPGSLAYTVLRLRALHPDDDSEQLAHRLSEKVGKPFRADAVRQQVRRARMRFAQALLEEVARGLADPNPQRVEEELIETGLMVYVQDLLPPDWRNTGTLEE